MLSPPERTLAPRNSLTLTKHGKSKDMNISEEEGASLGKRDETGTIAVWKTEQK